MSALEVTTYRPDERRPRMGFFTDTSVCIGCKACEVACKEWNRVPQSMQGFTGHSYDNTIDLGADTWRHVAFVEQRKELSPDGAGGLAQLAALEQLRDETGLGTYQDGDGMRWLMASDVCKHCTHAACLEVCPTGALMPTHEYELRQAGEWRPETQTVTDTTCPYCGVGCTLSVHVQDQRIVKVSSPLESEVTHGNLCVKGRFGFEYVNKK